MRDQHLRLGIRQQNWLRLEQLRRLSAARLVFLRVILRSLAREASLTRKQQLWRGRWFDFLPRATQRTKATTRCRYSGRTRQAFRDTQLARMQFRLFFSEGRLLNYHLGPK